MSAGPAPRARLSRSLLALALGTVSGAIANLVGLPLPWMLGAMIGTTLAILCGLELRGPNRLRPGVVPVIGVMLGSSITPGLFHDPARWTLTFAALAPFLVVAAAASYTLYRRVGRYDPVTAFFSAMPGGLNDMLILGAERGGIEKRIALAHACRILIVITFIVLFFGMVFDVRSSAGGGRWTPLSALSPRDWAILTGAAVVGALGGRALRLPAAPMLGPMLLSAAAHVTETVTVPPPTLLVIVAQVVIGTAIGCRFHGTTPREVGTDLMLGAASSAMMIAVAVGFATLVHVATGTDLSQVFLAFSPGGLTEMGLLALAMGQDVAYVSIMHLVRILLVIFTAAPAFRLIGGGTSPPPE